MNKSIIISLFIFLSCLTTTMAIAEDTQQKNETQTIIETPKAEEAPKEDLDTILNRLETKKEVEKPKISELADQYVDVELVLDNDNLPVTKEKLKKRYNKMFNRYVYRIENISEYPLQLLKTNVRTGKTEAEAAFEAVKIYNKGLFAASFIPVFGSIASIANVEKSMGNLEDTTKLSAQMMKNSSAQIFTQGDYVEVVIFTEKSKDEPEKQIQPVAQFTLFDMQNNKYISFTK